MSPLALSLAAFCFVVILGFLFIENRQEKDRKAVIAEKLHRYREQVSVSFVREELQLKKMLTFGGILFLSLIGIFEIGVLSTLSLFVLAGLFFVYKKRREKAILEKEVSLFLPQALDALGRSLRSGLSLFQALEIIRHQHYGLISKEIGHILDSMKLGITFKEALQKSAERVHVKAYQFLTLSLLIQQETGGSLVDLIYGLRDALRQKQYLIQKVAALSAQSRTSALVLAALPFLSFTGVFLMNREYAMIFIEDPRGQMMGLTALGLLSTGLFIINRLVKQHD